MHPNAAVTGRRRTTAAVTTMTMASIQISHVPLKCRRKSDGSILILVVGGTFVRSSVLMVNVAAGDGVALGVTTAGEI